MAIEFERPGTPRGHVWTAHKDSDLSSITSESRNETIQKLNIELMNVTEKNLGNLLDDEKNKVISSAADYVEMKYPDLPDADKARMTDVILEHHGFIEE